jgi:hypothetical protein
MRRFLDPSPEHLARPGFRFISAPIPRFALSRMSVRYGMVGERQVLRP